ncbi:MAG: hypothetical protein QXP36_12660, partial [Conexivisphaerales archaeon]
MRNIIIRLSLPVSDDMSKAFDKLSKNGIKKIFFQKVFEMFEDSNEQAIYDKMYAFLLGLYSPNKTVNIISKTDIQPAVKKKES